MRCSSCNKFKTANLGDPEECGMACLDENDVTVEYSLIDECEDCGNEMRSYSGQIQIPLSDTLKSHLEEVPEEERDSHFSFDVSFERTEEKRKEFGKSVKGSLVQVMVKVTCDHPEIEETIRDSEFISFSDMDLND